MERDKYYAVNSRVQLKYFFKYANTLKWNDTSISMWLNLKMIYGFLNHSYKFSLDYKWLFQCI